MKKIDIKEAKKHIKELPSYINMVLKLNLLTIINFLKNIGSFLKKRVKSYVFWASVGSFLYVALENLGVFSSPEQYENIINAVLGLCVLYGIIHDPTKEEKDKTIVEKNGDMITIKNIPAPKKPKRKKSWKNKLRNYGLWIAIASLVAIFVPRLFGIEFPLGDWKIFVDSILSILVIFGILNNPSTNSYGWKDDEF
jgi:uncharacterized membrane protein